MFKKHKDESKVCTMNALYALNPEGTFPSQMSTIHAKNVLRTFNFLSYFALSPNSDSLDLFEALIGILSMDFTVGGKKVEIDYMSQQRKESSRLLNIVHYLATL